MSGQPADLIALADFWIAHDGVNLGIIGNARHCRGYHLGSDRIYGSCACRPDGDCVAGLRDNDYSVKTARDKAGLSTHASAIDLGKLADSFTKLHTFSVWLVGRARANAIGTSDIREIIYSPDGNIVLRWDRERGINSEPRTGEADATHLTHTHISFYRDSRSRDKVRIFAPYFSEAEMPYQFKVERWTLDGGPAKVTTVGAPFKSDGITVDFSKRLALVSGTGGANPKLMEIARSRLTLPVDTLSDEFFSALASYAINDANCADEVAAATAPLLTKIAAARSALS